MEKQKKKKNNNGTLILGIIFLLGMYVAITLYQQQQEMKHLRYQQITYLQEIEELQSDIDTLQQHLEESSDDVYIERIARQQLRMIGEDELLIIDIGRH